ncbi:MAG: mandelate racemase/muconate lactonizing enzyme family protein [Betaproteobacteria bacterium]|nr:mandelate racemase/muconate lactonizing enzyme family protein [Betaproteobacteria bacterium]
MPAIATIEPIVVHVSSKTNWTFIGVTTDDGATGWGECSLNGWEPLLVAATEMLAQRCVGRTLDETVPLTCYLPHAPGGVVVQAVKSAVEQAVTDLCARASGVPVNVLLGRALRTSIPAYANINRGVAQRSASGFADAARRAVAAGYRAVKLAPFDGVIEQDALTTPIDELIHAGLDRVYAVRETIGHEHPLLVDCHWRFDEARAQAMLRDIGGAAPYWIECPISEHLSRFPAIARLRAVANSLGMRLAGGEWLLSSEQAEAMCAAGLYDVLMPDIKYAGGFTGMLQIAEVCERHGVAFSPHNPTGPIAHLASIHVSAIAPRLLWLEHQWGESELFDDLLGGDVAPLRNGEFVVPRNAGLGAALQRDVAGAHPFVALHDHANLDERLG